jgi:hypothetical protein
MVHKIASPYEGFWLFLRSGGCGSLLPIPLPDFLNGCFVVLIDLGRLCTFRSKFASRIGGVLVSRGVFPPGECQPS